MRILLYWLSTLCYCAICLVSGIGIYYQARGLHHFGTQAMALLYLGLCALAAVAALWFTWDCVGFPWLGRNRQVVASS